MTFQYFKKLNSLIATLPSGRPKGYLEKIPGDDDMVDSERASEDEPLTSEECCRALKAHRRPRSQVYSALIFHLGIMAIYTALFFTVMQPRSCHMDARSQIVHSPANEAVILEAESYNASLCIDTPFMGPPSPETDGAWTELLQYSHIKLTGEELRQNNAESIPLPDEEDSYWGLLGVAHELHCLKRLRQYMYKDHYFPNLTAEEEQLNLLHSGHCIEILRQAAICRGDVSIITMFWKDDVQIPIADFSLPHSCVNWDAIQDWSKARSFNPMKPGYMTHPKLGKPFADGHHHGIGVVDPSKHDQHSHRSLLPRELSMSELPIDCRF